MSLANKPSQVFFGGHAAGGRFFVSAKKTAAQRPPLIKSLDAFSVFAHCHIDLLLVICEGTALLRFVYPKTIHYAKHNAIEK